MTSIEFVLDRGQLEAAKEALSEKQLVKIARMAGGDAIRALRTASKNSVRFRKRIKAGRVADALQLGYPRGANKLTDLVWTMRVDGHAFRVSDYPVRQVRKGVSVAINKGARKVIPGAFIATLKSGHVGVFRRTGKKRLPIHELFTTRITDVFEDSGMTPIAFERAYQVFNSTFDRLFAAGR